MERREYLGSNVIWRYIFLKNFQKLSKYSNSQIQDDLLIATEKRNCNWEEKEEVEEEGGRVEEEKEEGRKNNKRNNTIIWLLSRNNGRPGQWNDIPQMLKENNY